MRLPRLDRQRHQTIYDCFTFYNELDLLELRLSELHDRVDQFVLVEATKTHRNNPKPLYFEEHKAEPRFAPYLDQLVHIVVDDLPDGPDSWEREGFQRDCITRGLPHLTKDDLVMISDLDEIPNPDKIGRLGSFQQRMCLYYLNLHTADPWFGTRCVTGEEIRAGLTPNEVRKARKARPHIKNGGWHFTFLGDEAFIANKVKEFAHSEYDDPQYTSPELIRQRIQTMTDVFARSSEPLTRVDIDRSFPRTVRANLSKYAGFILPALGG